jgi:hypothetical protein
MTKTCGCNVFKSTDSRKVIKHLTVVFLSVSIGVIIGLIMPRDGTLPTPASAAGTGKPAGASDTNHKAAADLEQGLLASVPGDKLHSLHNQADSDTENYIRIPKALLKYLKADTVNIESMTFKEPMLAALGLNESQRAALNDALKEISLQAADFQKQHCVLKRDKEGGQYYEIKPTAEELAAALRGFEAKTREALTGSDPAIAAAAYSLLEQSPLLSDFKYASQELSIIDNPGGGGADRKNFSIEIKRFDQTGNSVGRTVLLATPELLKTRYPFLLGSQ